VPLLARIKTLTLTGLSPLWRIYLQLRGVKVGGGFTCIGRPGMNLKRGSRIRLGNGVALCNSGMANPLAEGGRCRLATVAAGAELIIHDGVGMSSALICCANRVEIGSGTIIGGGAMILDTDFHPRLPNGSWGTDPKSVSKPVTIGKNCFIGARAVILKGVTIGDGAVIGAGALVSKDVAAHAIAVGNPSKELHQKTSSTPPQN
jgi:acetyltransferase-like isoleucine patch superfamily enzyme